MGGKNPVIVTENADIDKAVDGVARVRLRILRARNARRRPALYVERPVYDEFITKLAERANASCRRRPTARDTGTRTGDR